MHYLYKQSTLNSRFLLNLLLTIIFFGFIFSVADAKAAQVTLGWDQNPEPDLAGYKIYYRSCSASESCTSIGSASALTKITIPVYKLSNERHPTSQPTTIM